MADPQHDLKVWLDRKLREHPHGTKSKLAHAIGVTPTMVTRMKNTEEGKEPRSISLAEIEGIARFFNELPPGYEEMTMWLRPKSSSIVSSFDPDDNQPDEDPDWDGNGGGYVDGKIVFNRTIDGSQPEFSAKPGMGPGQTDDRTARVESNGIATGHPVVNEWYIPPSYIRHTLDAAPSQIMILPVVGHSMEPMLKSNDRVMVDISQNVWVGDAVYIIDDGDGVMQAKTVRKVMSSNPPSFEIVSEATPQADPIVRRYDQFRIVGRVVGRFTRM